MTNMEKPNVEISKDNDQEGEQMKQNFCSIETLEKLMKEHEEIMRDYQESCKIYEKHRKIFDKQRRIYEIFFKKVFQIPK